MSPLARVAQATFPIQSLPFSELLQMPLPEGARHGLQADLAHLALVDALEMFHGAGVTGLLQVQSEAAGGSTLPLELAFVAGELVCCALLDWRSSCALYASPQIMSRGQLDFWQLEPAAFVQLLPNKSPFSGTFEGVLGDWARMSDEWPHILRHITSPSQRFCGSLAPFDVAGGASVRRAVAETGEPLFEVASQVSGLVQAGFVEPVVGSFEWDLLVLPRLQAEVTQAGGAVDWLDGQSSLQCLMERHGLTPAHVRRDLLPYVSRGWHFAGAGRVLRDWTWEAETSA